MKQELLAAVKEFFEDALANGAVFDMGDIYEYVKSLQPDASIQELGDAMTRLQTKGEILWSAYEGASGKFCAAPPPNPQSTLFGATSGDSPKKPKEPAADSGKSMRFTKKQKEQALNELQSLPNLTPGLERLHDWLYEQVHG